MSTCIKDTKHSTTRVVQAETTNSWHPVSQCAGDAVTPASVTTTCCLFDVVVTVVGHSYHQWLQACKIKFSPFSKYFIALINIISVAPKLQVFTSLIPIQSGPTIFSKLRTCWAAAPEHNKFGWVELNIHQWDSRWFYLMDQFWRLSDWLNWRIFLCFSSSLACPEDWVE